MKPSHWNAARIFCAAIVLAGAAVPVAWAAALPALVLAPPDIEAALAADQSLPAPRPYRMAVAIPVQVSPATHGRWQTLADGGRRWQLEVTATGAQSLNFAFTRFALPAGAELRVGAPDGRDRHGPYRNEHATAGQLWTPPVRGSSAVIELRLAAGSRDVTGLQLTAVNYGFRGFAADAPQAKLRECHIDVACPEGDEWRNEIRSVARIMTGGTFGCTGQLVNNTAQDFRPFFLTAGHCLPAGGPEAASTVVMWNYQNSVCGGARDGNLSQTQTGASRRAGTFTVPVSTHPDFILLELSQKPPADFRVYYSGWDRRPLAPVGVVGISHPSGEEKRISLDEDPTELDGDSAESGLMPGASANIEVAGWSQGTTEPGSSGSGLWTLEEHRLVGVLSTESSDASCGQEGNSYTRFHSAWHYLPAEPTSVASHLDPLDSGVEVLDGADPHGLDLNPPAKARASSAPRLGAFSPALVALLLLAAGRRYLQFIRKTPARR